MPIPNIPNLAALQAKLHVKEYPLPAFSYAVYFDTPPEPKKPVDKPLISNPFKKQEQPAGLLEASFMEVSGLTQEIQSLDYRDGSDKIAVPRKIPGMPKYANITLKRGIFHKNTGLQDWFNERSYTKVTRKTVTIHLMNADGNAIVSWELLNAYPIKIDGPTLKADGNEIAIESVELVHEGLTVKHV